MGAKNGRGWPTTSWAMNQATPAATAHWPMCQDLLRSRASRSSNDTRLRTHMRSNGPASLTARR